MVIIAAILKAYMDYLQFSEIDSWRNKYKNRDPKQGEKFRFSTTFLVMFTDRWHMAQSLFLACIFAQIVTYKVHFNIWIDFILLRVIFGITFELFYRYFKQKWK